MLLRFPRRGHRRVPRLPGLGLPTAVPTWSTIFSPNFSHDSLWDNEFELSQTGLLADIRGPRTLGAKYLSFWEGTIGSQCIAVGKKPVPIYKFSRYYSVKFFLKKTQLILRSSQGIAYNFKFSLKKTKHNWFSDFLCVLQIFTRKLLLRCWLKVAPVWFRVRNVIKEAIMPAFQRCFSSENLALLRSSLCKLVYDFLIKTEKNPYFFWKIT